MARPAADPANSPDSEKIDAAIYRSRIAKAVALTWVWLKLT